MTPLRIEGEVAPGGEPVRDAFVRCFEELGETGAACAVWRGGSPLVNLWAGEARPDEAWKSDTLVGIYSTGKPLCALGLLLLVDRGLVDLEAPVTRYWPEYGANGKAGTTVRHVLTHRAGLMSLDPPLPGEELLDWAVVIDALAAAKPQWEPGREQGEHAFFYGHLVGEIAHRVSGVPFCEWLRREVAAPWDLGIFGGLRPEEQARCAALTDVDEARTASLAGDRSSRRGRALFAVTGMMRPEIVNGAAWREACIPAIGLHATARGIATMYAGLLAGGEWGGMRLLSDSLAREMRSEQCRGFDHFLEEKVRWGLGVQIDHDGFGHGGLGGSLGWADPETGLAFAYVTARMGSHDRATAVWEAARRI